MVVLKNLAGLPHRDVDAAVSLVVGMRLVPPLAGMPVEATYPFGPRLGAALNVTALPIGDQLHLGVNIGPLQLPARQCS